MNKFTRMLAVAGISGALAVGGAGIAQASTDKGQQVSPDKGRVALSKDRGNSRDRSKSRDKNGNSRDKGKSKDRGKHKHDHSKDHKHGKNHK
jgi:hypothetical protein